jgi:hypothetical protein
MDPMGGGMEFQETNAQIDQAATRFCRLLLPEQPTPWMGKNGEESASRFYSSIQQSG